MKFYKLLIILLLYCTINYSQRNSVYIEYGITITVEEFFLKDKIMSESFINAAEAANKLRFGLIIKNETSKFYDVNIGLDSDNNLKIAKIDAKYMGVIYNRNNEILKQSELLGKNIYTKENIVENWVLTNETKQIDNYLCYKATNEYTVVNPKGTFKFPVIAWYCPKLPYNFGPLGYGNLPGLILELQVRNVNYHLKKIDLNSDFDFDFDFLKNAKILTQVELDKKFDEFNDFDKK